MNRQSFFSALILMMVFNLSFYTNAQTKKVLLAVFAHPDDDETISPVLAKYAAEGVSVYVAVATDGRYGVTDHAKIPAGDSLAAVRKKEAECSAAKLGINPPIMFGLHDQLKMQEGINVISDQLDILRNKINELFENLKPDVIITWGPSGMTNHPDHILVGAMVTEVFESKTWGKPVSLYYPELVTGTVHDPLLTVATADSAYLPVKIKVDKIYYEKASAAWACHKSQSTPDDLEKEENEFWYSQKGTAYFRPFILTAKKQVSLFR